MGPRLERPHQHCNPRRGTPAPPVDRLVEAIDVVAKVSDPLILNTLASGKEVIISRGQTMYYGPLEDLRKSQQSRIVVQPAEKPICRPSSKAMPAKVRIFFRFTVSTPSASAPVWRRS